MSDLGNDLCKKLGPRRARDRGSPFSAPKEFSVEEYELAERGPGRWVVTWCLPLPARNGRARKVSVPRVQPSRGRLGDAPMSSRRAGAEVAAATIGAA